MYDNNLQFCREELSMTQKELGFVFGVDRSTVSGWETGKDFMPLTKLIRFCDLYKFSLDFVTGLSRENKDFNPIEKYNTKIIGENLKKIRKILGKTQQQIAKDCAIAQSTYSNYEKGLTLINTMTIYTICKKYNISMDSIIRSKIKSDSI